VACPSAVACQHPGSAPSMPPKLRRSGFPGTASLPAVILLWISARRPNPSLGMHAGVSSPSVRCAWPAKPQEAMGLAARTSAHRGSSACEDCSISLTKRVRFFPARVDTHQEVTILPFRSTTALCPRSANSIEPRWKRSRILADRRSELQYRRIGSAGKPAILSRYAGPRQSGL